MQRHDASRVVGDGVNFRAVLQKKSRRFGLAEIAGKVERREAVRGKGIDGGIEEGFLDPI